MDAEVVEHAKAVSKWLRENKNPHATIEITDEGLKMKSDEQFIPMRSSAVISRYSEGLRFKSNNGVLSVKIAHLDFGEAIKAVKEGKQIARKGWNGKNQFVYLIKGTDLQRGLKYGYGEYEGEPTITDVLAIKTTSNHIQIGWLASQTDMLAKDWEIV